MVYRIYTYNNLGLGQSQYGLGIPIVQYGSGKGMGRGFRSFGPMAETGTYGDGGTSAPQTVAPTPLAKHVVLNFDTIGQTIYRFLGHCRVPLRTIWAAGVEESGDVAVSNTQTFAAALGMPIDPAEEGEVFSLWDNNTQILNDNGVIVPIGWSDEDAALLALSLANMTIYPGDEAQFPDPLITADKGSSKTNAFRGIRYIVFPDYPIQGGSGVGGSGGNLPQMSASFRRTNPGDEPEPTAVAVEFLPGVT